MHVPVAGGSIGAGGSGTTYRGTGSKLGHDY